MRDDAPYHLLVGEEPAGPGFAYIAGEARTCQLARKHLLHERGWPRRNIMVHAFWP